MVGSAAVGRVVVAALMAAAAGVPLAAEIKHRSGVQGSKVQG
jgi:hypothetical protein